MKVNTDFPTAEEILQMMMSGEHLPARVDGTSTDAERAEAGVQAAEIARNGGVRIVCIGCGDAVPITGATACVCGGWVCEPCRAAETEGECDHEPIVLPEGARDDDDE